MSRNKSLVDELRKVRKEAAQIQFTKWSERGLQFKDPVEKFLREKRKNEKEQEGLSLKLN